MMRLPALSTGPGGSACALAAALLLSVAACRDSTGPAAGAATDVALAPAQFTLVSGTRVPGSFHFPAAGASGAQYLVVSQFATGTADLSGAFTLTGSLAAPVAAAPAPAVAAGTGSVAQRFHENLRRTEARLAAEARTAVVRPSASAALPAPATITPPVVGAKRTFRVCGDLQCSTLANVIATARYVGAHAALFLDDSAPAGGFTSADLSSLAQQFDTVLYPIDHAAFGAESDIDSNGVVIILLTPKVNKLVASPACQTSFVTGFFYGADIDLKYRSQYNNGEVFYGFVPDPAHSVTCPYTVATVRRMIAVTFIHEFQHMISYNQHVLVRGGTTEVLWLNEALSHLAEELGGRHYDSLGVDTTASEFYIGDLYNASQYLMDPSGVAMVTESGQGDLAQRGGEWLFVRYLTDRFGAQTPRSLVNTSLQGAANVAQATGTAFGTLLGRWALAVYTSDLAGFTAPPELRYENWHFRAVFASLNSQSQLDFPRVFPLVPTAASADSVAASGTLRSGSGSYALVTQSAGAGAFTLALRPGGSAFPATAGAQLAVVRLR